MGWPRENGCVWLRHFVRSSCGQRRGQTSRSRQLRAAAVQRHLEVRRTFQYQDCLTLSSVHWKPWVVIMLYLLHWSQTTHRNMRYCHWRQIWYFGHPRFWVEESHYKDKTVSRPSYLYYGNSFTCKTFVYTTIGVTLRTKIETARGVAFRKEILMCFVWYLSCDANRREQQWNSHLSICKHKVKFIEILNFQNLTTRCTVDPHGMIISRLWSNFHLAAHGDSKLLSRAG